jgi:digeranylgeranylglycerophospholipid reductase
MFRQHVSLRPRWDCVVVGASFAGLACANALARAGIRVLVLEKKADVGEKLHTTGIIVKDAIDQVPLLNGLPLELVHRVSGVRLYAPSLRYVDLAATDYYFLATDTPGVMRWLAGRAEQAGARIAYRTPFIQARRTPDGFDLGYMGTTRYLVGADGPNSRVAKALGLGRNEKFLFGMEHEYAGVRIADPHRMHCFFDRDIAPGYIAWVVSGVGMVQVGLARRLRDDRRTVATAMAAFLEKIAPIFDFRGVHPASVRAGMIPCGGVVRPETGEGVLLVGDAAGMVSPLTAGGIHTALKHGTAAGEAIAEHLYGRKRDPALWLAHSYPRFKFKRMLRFAFDHFQSDSLFNLLLGTTLMRAAASVVYFHRTGVFGSPTRAVGEHEPAARDIGSEQKKTR